jgi:enoyl-CoA hydratase/carnithine racemase
MQNLFNYTTLSTRLEKTTRTLFVTLNRPDWGNAFRLEMLFEIESLLAWCTSRVEINSVFFSSCTPLFSTGLELESLSSESAQSLDKINQKLHKIIFSMMQLPQTIVMDLGDGSETLGSEFALGADIRICREGAKIRFNHNHYGIVPCAGGMSMLSTLINPSYARHAVLTGGPIELERSGLIAQTYSTHNRELVLQEILTNIAQCAPVSRIQSKLGLFESLRSQIETGIVMDRKVAKASMISEDWKHKRPSPEVQKDFMPAKSMAYAVKLSLIKNDDIPSLEH